MKFLISYNIACILYIPEHSSRCVHVVCDEVGGESSNHHSLHLLSTGLHQVTQVVLLGNIAPWSELQIIVRETEREI